MEKDYTYESVPDVIAGFITVTAISPRNVKVTFKISIATHAIRTVSEGLVGEDTPATAIALVGSDTSYSVMESYERVMALINQSQHQAS